MLKTNFMLLKNQVLKAAPEQKAQLMEKLKVIQKDIVKAKKKVEKLKNQKKTLAKQDKWKNVPPLKLQLSYK